MRLEIDQRIPDYHGARPIAEMKRHLPGDGAFDRDRRQPGNQISAARTGRGHLC